MREYDLESWVSVNQLVTLSLEEWFSLPPLLKRAVSIAVENLSNEINSKRKEQEMKLQMEKLDVQQRLQFGKPNTSIDKYFK